MSDHSKIEWTDSTWNVVRGCSRVSEGCRNCYAERQAIRQVGTAAKPGPYFGLVESTPAGPRWTGDVRLVQDLLEQPLRWRRPRRIFVNAMSDLFHESISFDEIDKVFAVMGLASRHTFQILTKRPERQLEYMKTLGRHSSVDGPAEAARTMGLDGEWAYSLSDAGWTLPNVWVGVSIEDQKTADERIPLLLQTPAAVRWVSYEPALGPVDLREIELPAEFNITRSVPGLIDALTPDSEARYWEAPTGLDWIVAGGESGPGARPSHPDWFRSVRDQCREAEVPFLFKQWGDWEPVTPQYPPDDRDIEDAMAGRSYRTICIERSGNIPVTETRVFHQPDLSGWIMERVGKKAAGRQLDGKVHDEYPEDVSVVIDRNDDDADERVAGLRVLGISARTT